MADTEPKLTITRQGMRIVVRVRVEAVSETFEWSFSAPTEWAAILLLQALRDALGSRMSAIRREAYEQGWKDAKAKKAKFNWFSERLP